MEENEKKIPEPVRYWLGWTRNAFMLIGMASTYMVYQVLDGRYEFSYKKILSRSEEIQEANSRIMEDYPVKHK